MKREVRKERSQTADSDSSMVQRNAGTSPIMNEFALRVIIANVYR